MNEAARANSFLVKSIMDVQQRGAEDVRKLSDIDIRKLVSDETTDLRNRFSVERYLIGRTKTIHKTLEPVWVEHTKEVPVEALKQLGTGGKGRKKRSSLHAKNAGSTMTARARGATNGSAAPTRRKIIEESIGYSLKKQLGRLQGDAILHNVTEPWVFNVRHEVPTLPLVLCTLACSLLVSLTHSRTHVLAPTFSQEETTDMLAFRYPLLQPVRYESDRVSASLIPWSDTDAEIWISIFDEDFSMKDGFSDDVLGQVRVPLRALVGSKEVEALGGGQPIMVVTRDIQLPLGKGKLPRKLEERFIAEKKLGTITFALCLELRETKEWNSAREDAQQHELSEALEKVLGHTEKKSEGFWGKLRAAKVRRQHVLCVIYSYCTVQ
jgi:hypothetical protein